MYQTDPPLAARETLPTMYDLPSEDPDDPGLPDYFHLLQMYLLMDTFCPPNYPSDQIFNAGNMYLYYDSRHPLWHISPDWFAVVGVPFLYENKDLRLSYVVWQESVSPYIVVELLSPGTEREDLGQTLREVNQPPGKWEVYEKILRIPYYAIFDRYQFQFRMFKLNGSAYEEVTLSDNRFWIPDLELGLGVWEGNYKNAEMSWLRWYDKNGDWVLTATEREAQKAEQERQRAEQERQKTERLIAQLRALGVEPDLD
jgi:Uma2 family endonuclease